MPVAPVTPALFTANTTGTGPAAALNQNSTVNSAANPAHLGSTIVLFATGAGYTTNAVDGQPAPTTCGISCLPIPQGTVTVKIGNQFVTPSYAGGAPSLVAGVMQVNATIPTTIIPGAVLVEVLVNGYPTQPGVTIAVTGNNLFCFLTKQCRYGLANNVGTAFSPYGRAKLDGFCPARPDYCVASRHSSICVRRAAPSASV